jgi:hypothetical protein
MFLGGIPGRAGARDLGHALAALALLGCVGCAEKRPIPDFSGSTRTLGREPVLVEVVNDNYHDVVVYLDHGAGWQRLETVTGLCEVQLEISSTLQSAESRYYIRVHAIGTSDSEDYFSGMIFADPGTRIELNVASVLSLSSWSVRGRDAT